MTNQQLSDLSDVPLGTVAGITSRHNSRTPSYATAQRLMKALGQEILIPETESEETMEKLNAVEITHALINLYERTIKSKDKWIIVLAAFLAIMVLFIMGVLIYDITHPNIGWFQQ